MLDDYPNINGLEITRNLDVTGGSAILGVNRFKFEDKGWPKAKEMKPVNLFK